MSEQDNSKHDNTYEASWAPADPRDADLANARFGDGRVGSKVRIFAVMHPVFNLFVLAFDSIFNRSRLAVTGLLLILLGLLLVLWLSGVFSTVF